MGCALNRYRAQELTFDLAKNGFSVHNQPFGSDRDFFRENGEKALAAGIKIWVLYVCPITGFLEKLAEKFIKNIRQNYPQSAVVISGCGSWRAPRLAKGTIIKKAEQVSAFIKERPNGRRRLGARGQIKTGTVLVKNGCGNHCAYCVCPLVNKDDQCRPLDEICEQLRDLRARGIRSIELAGPCVGDWRSAGLDFTGLLELILRKFRFNLVNLELHPKDIHSRLIAVLAHPRISSRISVPVQSGSNCVLKRMNRKYDRAFLEKVLSELFAKKKHLSLTTDIIAGSPGETEKDFEETLKLLKKFPFTRVDIYAHSAKIGPIKNNPAARKMIRRLLRDESLKKIANVTSQ